MRLAPDNPLTAAAIVNRWPMEPIELLLKEYGEDPRPPHSRANRRSPPAQPFTTTRDFSGLHREPRAGALPARTRHARPSWLCASRSTRARKSHRAGSRTSWPIYKRRQALRDHLSFSRGSHVKNISPPSPAQGKCRFWKADGIAPAAPVRPGNRRQPRARSATLRAMEKT